MAQVTEVRLVDDLDGGAADESVAFGLDGRSYEIDLSEKHAVELREILAPFVGAARRAGRAAAPARSTSRAATTGEDRERNAEIRIWAREHGLNVSERGRISSEVLAAYENRGATVVAPKVEPEPEPAAPAEDTVTPVVADKPKRARRKKADAAV